MPARHQTKGAAPDGPRLTLASPFYKDVAPTALSLVGRFENVSGVKYHAECFQQFGVFIPKRFLGVVLLLILDVTNYGTQL